MKDNEKCLVLAGVLTTLGVILLIPVLLVYITLTYGYVLSCLWSWFVVPLGVVEINLWQAYGLSLILALITFKPDVYKKEKRDLDSGKIFGALTSPWITLLLGYIVSLLM
jgi:hypothetical protein